MADTDVIIWEGDPEDPTRKPPEMYTLIENFCLGTRRLEVSGKLSSLRRGWVTVLAPGQDEHLPASGALHVEGEEGGLANRWVEQTWQEGIKEVSSGKPVVPMTSEIDALRPKSPPRPGHSQNNSNSNSNNMSGGPNPSVPMAQPMGGPNRFSQGRCGFAPTGQVKQQQMVGQNQMMMNPMMGMGAHQMGMGMGNMDELMGGWNPMMNGMGGMNMVGGGMPHGNMAGNRGMVNTGMGNAGMAGMNANAGMSVMNNAGLGIGNNAMAAQMGNNALGVGGIPMHMNMMGMGNQFPMQGGAGGGGFGQMGGFNGAMNAWGDQGQFGMESGVMGNNIPGMGGGMSMGNMGNMPMGGMGMGHQWNGQGNF